MSPYKGLRIMARSGQGLLNSDTELKELVSKVLGDEIVQNKCKVVADDLVIGGKPKIWQSKTMLRYCQNYRQPILN